MANIRVRKELVNYGNAPYDHLRMLLRHRNSVPVSGNGAVHVNDDGTVSLRLHATDILRCEADGTVTINTGGYHTVTTKNWLCAALPSSVRIWQTNYEWHIAIRNGNGEYETHEYEDGTRLRFVNGAVRLVA